MHLPANRPCRGRGMRTGTSGMHTRETVRPPFRLDDLLLQGPAQPVSLDAPAGLAVLEFEDDASLEGILFLDPVAADRAAVEGRLGLLAVKVDLSADELLRIVF